MEEKTRKLLGFDFNPETREEKSYIDLLEYINGKGLLSDQHIQIVLAEYSVSKEPIGAILVRNGFLSHKDYLRCLIEFSPDAISNEESISDSIDPELLIELSTMIVAEEENNIYVSTLGNEMMVRSRIQEVMPNADIVFLPTSVDKIDSYMDKLQEFNSGESNALEKMIKKALRMGASDIHIIPKDNSYSVFFRIIGVKSLIHEGDIEEYNSLIARIKDRSKMDLAEKRIPQDGGFQIEHKGKMIDMRVATIPSVIGDELVVIRLLDPDSVKPSLDLLGISNLAEWRKGVSRPDGLALICGPTGSGKTTTLQASIREMNRFEKAIFTVEDPVEYRIPFTGQVNINRTVGLDFPTAIRAFMRADPDIIMVGEIRDEETARIAIKGAETGHLVVGTLHTRSIKSTIDRLRDLGISNKELRYILRTVLVQRLLRTLCEECHGSGCERCHEQGYNGRTVVSECAYFKDEQAIDDMIEGKASWSSMLEDAISKINSGLTDAHEVIRVFGEEAIEELKKRGMMDE